MNFPCHILWRAGKYWSARNAPTAQENSTEHQRINPANLKSHKKYTIKVLVLISRARGGERENPSLGRGAGSRHCLVLGT